MRLASLPPEELLTTVTLKTLEVTVAWKRSHSEEFARIAVGLLMGIGVLGLLVPIFVHARHWWPRNSKLHLQ